MSRLYDYYALLLGRILIGGFFLWDGILKTLNISATAKGFSALHAGIDPLWVAIAVVAVEVVGGIGIIVAWNIRYSALALALYFILATLLFQPALQDPSAANYFLKNMSLIGALLYISATND